MADQERILPGRGPTVKHTMRVPAGGATLAKPVHSLSSVLVLSVLRRDVTGTMTVGYEIILRRE
jgi:hypothetical protein